MAVCLVTVLWTYGVTYLVCCFLWTADNGRWSSSVWHQLSFLYRIVSNWTLFHIFIVCTSVTSISVNWEKDALIDKGLTLWNMKNMVTCKYFPHHCRKVAALKVPRLHPCVFQIRVVETWRWVWSIDGMILTRGNWSTGREKPVTLPIHLPQISHGLTRDQTPGLHDERLATDGLIRGASNWGAYLT